MKQRRARRAKEDPMANAGAWQPSDWLTWQIQRDYLRNTHPSMTPQQLDRAAAYRLRHQRGAEACCD